MIEAFFVFVFAISVFAATPRFDRDAIISAAKNGKLPYEALLSSSLLTTLDGIDLNILPIASTALDSIEALYTPVVVPAALQNATRIDVHCKYRTVKLGTR
jgi:hypothetical protein